MSLNSTISCSWPSAAAVVGSIQANKLNVSDIVAQCENVCQIIFETKNPDIAGDGVIIGIFTQVVLVTVFAAFLPGFVWLVTFLSWKGCIRRIPLFRKIHKSLYIISAFFTLSLLLSTIVLQSHAPPVLEVVYISKLLKLELFVVICMLFTQLADNIMNKKNLGWPWNLNYITIAGALLVTSCTVSIPNQAIYHELATECDNQKQFVNVGSAIKDFSSGTDGLKWYGIGVAIGLGGSILSGILSLFRFWRWIWSWVPAWVKKHGDVLFFGFFPLWYAMTIILLAVLIETPRSLIKETRGPMYQGNDWGCAQTTPILLWALFLWNAVMETAKYFTKRPSSKDIAAEMEDLEQESRLPPPGPMLPPPPPFSASAVPPPYSAGKESQGKLDSESIV